jgi:hypothetical protein
MVFSVATACSSVKNRRFGGTHRLHLQAQRVSQAKKKKKPAEAKLCLPTVPAGCLPGLLFNHEDRADMFL